LERCGAAGKGEAVIDELMPAACGRLWGHGCAKARARRAVGTPRSSRDRGCERRTVEGGRKRCAGPQSSAKTTVYTVGAAKGGRSGGADATSALGVLRRGSGVGQSK
jgi:hypothetical protein